MAGLIAAVANNGVGIVGIAPQARIEVFEAWATAAEYGRRVLQHLHARPGDRGGAGRPYSADQHEHCRTGRSPAVSAGGERPEAWRDLCRFGGGRRGLFPANVNGVLGVTNSDRGPQGGLLAMLAMPATHVLTLRPGAEYDFESGTSVAAAEMTGVVALLLSANSRADGRLDRVLVENFRAARCQRGVGQGGSGKNQQPAGARESLTLAGFEALPGARRRVCEVPGRTRKPDPTPPRFRSVSRLYRRRRVSDSQMRRGRLQNRIPGR